MTPAKRPSTRARQTRIQSLDDLQPDPLNANRGTDRGREALRRSLHTYGAGRSIVIDTRGRILGGHKTVEQAKHLGLPITVVPTTGETLVVVQRVDLDARTDPRAQELALADNRVAELDLDWDPAVLRQLEQAGVALEAFWTPEEFARLLAPEGPEAQPDENTVLAPPTTTTIRGVIARIVTGPHDAPGCRPRSPRRGARGQTETTRERPYATRKRPINAQ